MISPHGASASEVPNRPWAKVLELPEGYRLCVRRNRCSKRHTRSKHGSPRHPISVARNCTFTARQTPERPARCPAGVTCCVSCGPDPRLWALRNWYEALCSQASKALPLMTGREVSSRPGVRRDQLGSVRTGQPPPQPCEHSIRDRRQNRPPRPLPSPRSPDPCLTGSGSRIWGGLPSAFSSSVL